MRSRTTPPSRRKIHTKQAAQEVGRETRPHRERDARAPHTLRASAGIHLKRRGTPIPSGSFGSGGAFVRSRLWREPVSAWRWRWTAVAAGYLKRVCDYVLLTPTRASLLAPEQAVSVLNCRSRAQAPADVSSRNSKATFADT
jgi:hypothetical protein